MKRPVEDGLSLLVGAGIGVTLLYLLDPAAGPQRRKIIRETAADGLSRAERAASAGVDYLHSAVARASNSPAAVQGLAASGVNAAKSAYEGFTGNIREGAEHYERLARETGEAMSGKVSERLRHLGNNAAQLKQQAVSHYGDWLNRSTKALGRDEDHHYVGQTTCALGSLALGAGLVYLLDPAEGTHRRERVVATTLRAVSETGDFFRKVGRRMVGRSKALVRDVAEKAVDINAQWHSEANTDADARVGTESASQNPSPQASQQA